MRRSELQVILWCGHRDRLIARKDLAVWFRYQGLRDFYGKWQFGSSPRNQTAISSPNEFSYSKN